MAKLRVVVAEDSVTVRKRLCEVLSSDREIEIVGEAEDGKEAVRLCQALKPDVLTMDMMMPLMTGLAATEYIMAHCPTPILVVSSSINRGELFRTYDALAAGAVDVLSKPSGDEHEGVWEQLFISTVKLVARIRVITHIRARLNGAGRASPPAPAKLESTTPGSSCKLIAVGASTGGPAALVEVLRALPSSLPIPVLVVLHINEPFGMAFADWLDAQIPLRVAYAKDGESLTGATGRVLMAPPDRHLVVSGDRLRLNHDAERHSCRPSVDVLFESIARDCGATTAACLLTGMGRDGAAGLLDIRRSGGMTIAQDEASSVIYGMPREAALLGAAMRVLPLREIGPALAVHAGVGQGVRQ